ncbi:MAG: hypothetical protein IPJ76_07325 [Flavobacteriales bacterium]|nr:MAG: hypothetical protein IPJ76_07325 [Flavobacteriales bacterium]
MIRYPTTLKALQQAVDALPVPTGKSATGRGKSWRERAEERTRGFIDAEGYTKETAIWSEVKPVFDGLQMGKCAFCERALESKKEKDIEHFRPKSGLKAWKPPKGFDATGLTFSTITSPDPGYYKLVYHLLNYSVACARCNGDLKSNMFPIGVKTHDVKGADPVKLKREKPYLVFPIGNWDEDPEDLIDFEGLFPLPKKKKGTAGYQRARVTIAFFKLDDYNYRREIFRGRAEAIEKIGMARELLSGTGTTAALRDQCKAIIAYQTSPQAQYTSCARAFNGLWDSDVVKARKIFKIAVDFLAGVSPPRPDPR